MKQFKKSCAPHERWKKVASLSLLPPSSQHICHSKITSKPHSTHFKNQSTPQQTPPTLPNFSNHPNPFQKINCFSYFESPATKNSKNSNTSKNSKNSKNSRKLKLFKKSKKTFPHSIFIFFTQISHIFTSFLTPLCSLK